MKQNKQLGEVIKSISITHKFDKNELIFLNTSDVLEGKILSNKYFFVSELKGQAKKTIQNNDILYSEIRPKNKRFAFVNVQNPEDYVVSTKLMVLRNITNDVDTKYIYYFLTYEGTINYLQMRAENRIGSFPQITFDILKPIYISLPKLEEQKKIVKIISSIDDKIELNNKINNELEAMAKTLYDYWFVQFDFPDEHGKPYKSSGGKMVYNQELKREIPEGWEVENIFKLMDVQYGFPFDTSKFTDDVSQKPIVRIRDILQNTISTYSFEEIDNKFMLNKNDLLIGMDGNFHINFWNETGAYLNQRSVRIRTKEGSKISNFQVYFEITPYIKAREKNVSRTTVGHLSDKDLKSIFLLVPNLKLNHKSIFDSILNKLIMNRVQNQELSKLRDWLLPMLMNGQVKVK
ncbi:restriction endonuclease subunit S [Aliarcobacter cryaerophilus]|uniref:restriction endonuclease subunit S n=1 Tax=Aliarcobacter cryaerophilus TaxID=28198 RepID=UPI003DA1F186